MNDLLGAVKTYRNYMHSVWLSHAENLFGKSRYPERGDPACGTWLNPLDLVDLSLRSLDR